MLYLKLFSIITIIILVNRPSGICGSRFLGIFPLKSRSHMSMFEQLMKGLARRGHQVDVISVFPQKKPYPNYTNIVIPSSIPNFINNMSYQVFHEIAQGNVLHTCASMAGNDICEAIFSYGEIQKLIKNPPKNPPYDAVITEILCASCLLGIGYHLKVPVIGMSASTLPPWINDILANPTNLAFMPNIGHGYVKNMNYWNRLYNVLYTAYNKIYFNSYTSLQSDIIKKYFGSDAPDVRELEQDVALILVNSHKSLNGVKPTIQSVVEVGGIHIQDDDSEISMEHKKWLDESNAGFIYFTFGSMVTIESFPKQTLENIYKSFKKIAPIRVFMKVPEPKLLPPGLPNNVRIFNWISQLKVLKHKNIRAFITHGGLMSTQEAISCGVPMIGIPLFYDQVMNIGLYVERNIAIHLDYHELTESNLDMALNNILYNPIYSEAAKNISKKFLDRPLSPMDEACYWVEYIIKHGKKALRSPAIDLSWWQLELLDVYFTLLAIIILTLFTLIYLIKFLINIVNKKSLYIDEFKKHN